jgi:hypothetical protein
MIFRRGREDPPLKPTTVVRSPTPNCSTHVRAMVTPGWKNCQKRACVVAPSGSTNSWTPWCKSVERPGGSCWQKAKSSLPRHEAHGKTRRRLARSRERRTEAAGSAWLRSGSNNRKPANECQQNRSAKRRPGICRQMEELRLTWSEFFCGWLRC